MILTSIARRIAPNADRFNFFTRSPPRKMPRQAQGIAVIPENAQIAGISYYELDVFMRL